MPMINHRVETQADCPASLAQAPHRVDSPGNRRHSMFEFFMAKMITKTEDGTLIVVLSKRFYEKPAVLRAAYKLSNLCIIDMHPKGTDEVQIGFEKKPDQKTLELESIAHRFCDEVIDQQIRLDLEKRTKEIREIIIRHAFEPISDLMRAVEDAD